MLVVGVTLSVAFFSAGKGPAASMALGVTGMALARLAISTP
ncbi:hypothetical protein ABEG17_01735 [Pedococcus sp. KACC 23699]|uniref:Uncharacterized protein n=1 Tax=Pedococcus sp. KACC 23699 TaxID=3149228 RepID=A0AAU7JVD3_9MICO